MKACSRIVRSLKNLKWLISVRRACASAYAKFNPSSPSSSPIRRSLSIGFTHSTDLLPSPSISLIPNLIASSIVSGCRRRRRCTAIDDRSGEAVGVMKLGDVVSECKYSDVHVMWSILKETEKHHLQQAASMAFAN